MPAVNNIQYSLKKSNRKTLSIYVEVDGSISVLAPIHKTDEDINKAIESKQLQIYRKISELNELRESQVIRELVNGESYLYLGRNYRLQFVDSQNVPVKLENGYFKICRNNKLPVEQLLKKYYKEKCIQKVKERIKIYSAQMRVEFNQLKVMELKNRWASYSPATRNINFNWKCIMAPLNVIDYIVVHELAHIKHNNHSDAFWSEVDKVIPDYRERLEWLRYNGASISI